MRPLQRFALIAVVATALVGGAVAAWAMAGEPPRPRPPAEVVVGESASPDTLPGSRPPAEGSPSPSASPSRGPGTGTDNGVVSPPPAVTGGDDDDDDGNGDDDDDDD